MLQRRGCAPGTVLLPTTRRLAGGVPGHGGSARGEEGCHGVHTTNVDSCEAEPPPVASLVTLEQGDVSGAGGRAAL